MTYVTGLTNGVIRLVDHAAFCNALLRTCQICFWPGVLVTTPLDVLQYPS